MSNPFTFHLDKAIIEAQREKTGNEPRDLVEPYNYPYKLIPNWHIYAVQGNLWRCRLADAQVLTGGNDDTTVAEGAFYFEHIVRDVYFYQYTSAGVRDNDALTWEWSREIGGAYFPIRAGDAQPEYNWAVEDILYRTNGENYRWRFNGTATNVVEVEVWIEVLRI